MWLKIELTGPQQDRAADDQRKAHHPRIEQVGLDVSAGSGADYRRRQKRHQHADHEPPVIGIGEHPERDPPQFDKIYGDNRQDRAELNQHRKTLPETALAEMDE